MQEIMQQQSLGIYILKKLFWGALRVLLNWIVGTCWKFYEEISGLPGGFHGESPVKCLIALIVPALVTLP